MEVKWSEYRSFQKATFQVKAFQTGRIFKTKWYLIQQTLDCRNMKLKGDGILLKTFHVGVFDFQTKNRLD